MVAYQNLCVTLWHMSIGTRVVVAVTFQKIDCAPDGKPGSESDDEGLEDVHCAVEKCHK